MIMQGKVDKCPVFDNLYGFIPILIIGVTIVIQSNCRTIQYINAYQGEYCM